jgi:hypothetical protein
MLLIIMMMITIIMIIKDIHKGPYIISKNHSKVLYNVENTQRWGGGDKYNGWNGHII